MTAPLDRTSQIAGRSWTHPVPKFWIGIETHDSWHIPLEAHASSPAPGGSTVRRGTEERSCQGLSWRALSHGIGRCGNLVSFLILFDPVFANLHFTVPRSFSCSHMGENCRAETSNTLVESFRIFNLILQCAFGIFPQTVWLHWGSLNVGCRLVAGYPIVSFFS